jgi:hypothetical protein
MAAKQGGKAKAKQSDSKKLQRARCRRNAQDRHRLLAAAQAERETANAFITSLPDGRLAEIRRQHDAGVSRKAIAQAFKTTELAVSRALEYGQITPWQHAKARRAQARTGTPLA